MKNKLDKSYLYKNLDYEKILFILIMAAGLFIRLWQFGNVPDGVNQDEAFAGYEAYSILHYGKDSFGYHMPVYLTAWGSGMNALNSYLMIPFIAVFGLKTWVIRLPQVIVALFSIWVCYLLMKKLFDKKMALIAMFILAIVPWHIMLSRWGLESNLAPGFLLFGLYFFVLGMEKSKYFIVSAIMYGLSLYSYATIWPIVPIMLLLQVLYALYIRSIKLEKNTVLSVVILGIFALPLILFMLVNTGRINEIRSAFISVPKLLYFRGGELSFSNIAGNLKNVFIILLKQTDGLVTNVCDKYGLFYKISIIFWIPGIVITVYQTIKSVCKRTKSGYPIILIQFLGGLLLSALIEVNVNRANCFMMSIVLMTAIGIYYMGKVINWKLVPVVAVIYMAMFLSFSHYYLTEYNTVSEVNFCAGLGEALDKAMDRAAEKDATIYVTSNVAHSRVMFYSRIPVDEYINTVVYNNYAGPFVGIDSFGRFVMNFDLYTNIDQDGIYILTTGSDISPLIKAGFNKQTYGIFVLLTKDE